MLHSTEVKKVAHIVVEVKRNARAATLGKIDSEFLIAKGALCATAAAIGYAADSFQQRYSGASGWQYGNR